MKVRAWTETRHRAISTDDTPLVVGPGDIVLIAVVKSWEEAAELMRTPPEPRREGE